MVKSCNSQDIFLKKGAPTDDAYGGGGGWGGRGYGGERGADDGPRRAGGGRDRISALDRGFAPSRSRTPPPRGDRTRDRDRDWDRDLGGKGFGYNDKGTPKGYGKGFWDGFGGKDPWFGKGMGPMGFWDPFGKGGKGFDGFRGGKGFGGFGGFGKDRGFGPKGWGKDDRGGKGARGGGKGGEGKGDRGRRGGSPEPSSSALDADLEEYFTGKRPAGSAAKELARELSSRGGGKGKGTPASESKLDMDLDSYMGRGEEEPAAAKEAKSDDKEKDAKAEGDALAAEADKEVEPKVVGSGDKAPDNDEKNKPEDGTKKVDEEKKAAS